MQGRATEATNDVDLILFLTEPGKPGPGDEFIINH